MYIFDQDETFSTFKTFNTKGVNMLISNHISTDSYEVLPSDSISFVLDKMNDLYCKQLAVVENAIYYGLIEEHILLEEYEITLPIKHLQAYFKPIHLYDSQHIYDALQVIANNDLSFIPILDNNQQYLGVLTTQNLLINLNELFGNEESAIIVLELGIRDNALSHIARIIEAENTIIYNTAIRQIPDSPTLEMTITLNRINISAVIASLWRNDYIIKAAFRDHADNTDIKNRYQLLMNYLDM